MILADKIIRLRKKNGWSQEELAERMNVSRQAVSKWEGAQTVPDLEKILLLGEIFGVTTDYLLKDDIEDEVYTEDGEASNVRRVSLEAANEFLALRQKASLRIALGVLLCILAPIPLIFLGVAAEQSLLPFSEDAAAAIGLVSLFITVAVAVGIFIYCGFKKSQYEFLDKESFEAAYGVKGMVKERQKSYRNTYVKYNMIGVCLCVLSPVALFAGVFVNNDMLAAAAFAAMLVLAGIGVTFLVTAGIRWESMLKLLKEGEYSDESKKRNKLKGKIASIYWTATTAVYLGYSFATDNWERSWIVWPIAAVLFAAVVHVCNIFAERRDSDS